MSRKITLSQGTGQGRILAPFMVKVYVNGLLNVLSNDCYAIFINGLCIPSPSFADDICLFTLHTSFLKTFMNICNRYGINWRYDFNHSKSGIIMFGETKLQHFESLKNREWFLGDTKLEELYEYENLSVLKNYVSSFSSNIDNNIDKTRKKVGMIFSSNLDRRKVNPLIGRQGLGGPLTKAMLLWLGAYMCNWLSGWLAIFLCLVRGFRPRFHSVWSRPLCNCLVKKINQGTDVLTHNCLPPLLALCVDPLY